MAEIQTVNDPYDLGVADAIQSIRTLPSKEIREWQKNKQCFTIMQRAISEHCDLYYDRNACYLFLVPAKKLMKIDAEEKSFQRLMFAFSINPTELVYKYCIAQLKIFVRKNGKEIQVRYHSHYCPDKQAVYIDRYDDHVIKITATEVSVVHNGTDEVLFLEVPLAEPFNLVEIKPDESPLSDHLINLINFKDDILSVQESRAIFRFCILAMYFRSIMMTRPITVFKGQKGSGKTLGLKLFGQVLFGSKFSVMQMTSDSKDFDAAVTNSPYIVIDNLDTPVKWLYDRLAIIATGGSIKKRELYTTNTMVDIPLDCFMFITSREPKFLRDDIADRTILFNLKRFDKFISEKRIRNTLLENRDKIMSEIVREIQNALKALSDQKDYQPEIEFRIADFGEFMLKVMRNQDKEAEAQTILRHISTQQHTMIIDSDPMLRLLSDWIEDNQGREIATKDLAIELSCRAAELRIPFPMAQSVRSFGRKLKAYLPDLQSKYTVTFRTCGQGVVKYQFTDIGEARCQ